MMKKVNLVFIGLLFGVAVASTSLAQTITLSFDEGSIVHRADGRSDLVPNPDLEGAPSAVVYVLAYDLAELYGYEYRIDSNDNTAITGTPTLYPIATTENFGTNGDVRTGTGICFQANDPASGPNPAQIRLARHIYTWFAPPAYDVLFCLGPSEASGVPAPQYTECVQNPVPLPFALDDGPCGSVLLKQGPGGDPPGCAIVLFEWEPDGITPTNCLEPVAASSTTWGALKAAY